MVRLERRRAQIGQHHLHGLPRESEELVSMDGSLTWIAVHISFMKSLYAKNCINVLVLSYSKRHLRRVFIALNALNGWDHKEFQKVNKYLRIILVHPEFKSYNYVDVIKRAWVVGCGFFDIEDYDIPYMASLLIHESHHIAQHQTGHRSYGQKAEGLALNRQKKFLKKIKYSFAVKWLDKKFKSSWWKALDRQKNNRIKAEKLLHKFLDDKLNVEYIK